MVFNATKLLRYEKAHSLRLLLSAARVYTRSTVINFRIPGHWLASLWMTNMLSVIPRDKAGSNQPPAHDPVQFKLELTPNYLISYLENTGSRSTRYVSMPHPNESSILPKFLEKSDPEVARPAFSTWPVQKTQPKAFELCASIQIHQSA